LARTLAGLKAQTLPMEQWELLLIDNASENHLSDFLDLSWHPDARHIREDRLGKTQALLRGIREAKGNVLVVVDDDNILAPNYLTCSLEKANEHPEVGVWSGNNIPEFETIPASWKQEFYPYLAISHEDKDRISKDIETAPLPIGAGMVFRRDVAKEYLHWMTSLTKRRISVDRRGSGLYAGEEDTELGIIAIKNGFACGRTPSLRLTHLMPRRRISAVYLFRIARDISYSHILIYRWHGLQRAEFTKRDLFEQSVRSFLLVIIGAASGNAKRFGRGMVGIASLCGTLQALQSR